MASSKIQLQGFEVDDTLNTPIVLKGVEGVNYIKTQMKVKDASEVTIGGIYVSVTSTHTIDKAGDLGTNVCCQVLDTAYNKALLSKGNSGADPTLALYFAANDYVDVLIPLPGLITKVQVGANNAIEIGSKIGVYTSGDVKLWATTAGAIIGKALSSVATGTGTQWIAMVWLI